MHLPFGTLLEEELPCYLHPCYRSPLLPSVNINVRETPPCALLWEEQAQRWQDCSHLFATVIRECQQCAHLPAHRWASGWRTCLKQWLFSLLISPFVKNWAPTNGEQQGYYWQFWSNPGHIQGYLSPLDKPGNIRHNPGITPFWQFWQEASPP